MWLYGIHDFSMSRNKGTKTVQFLGHFSTTVRHKKYVRLMKMSRVSFFKFAPARRVLKNCLLYTIVGLIYECGSMVDYWDHMWI